MQRKRPEAAMPLSGAEAVGSPVGGPGKNRAAPTPMRAKRMARTTGKTSRGGDRGGWTVDWL